jgi:hypothetical protein
MTDCALFGQPITRRIWMDVDNLILVYVGSAAEFPLVPENDWLFYTGKLPSAPMERFIDTLGFNHRIFTSTVDEVDRMATQIRKIHTNLEEQRRAEEGAPRLFRIAYLAYPKLRCRLVAATARYLFLTPEVRRALQRMEQINATLQAA